jgi:glycosidase
MLDAQFDFNVYDAALATFAAGNPSFDLLHNRLLQSLDYYGSHNLMGYITGNQDRGRFISYAGGDLDFSEDAKAAGWTREIGVGDPVGYDRLRMLMAFNMTIPGIPVIYYGDEIGMPGGNDPDNRRMMKFSGLSEEEMQTREVTSYLAKLRRDNMALIYGDYIPVHNEDGIYSYARKYFEEEALVIFNNNNEEKTIGIDLPDLMEFREMEANFGYGFEVNEGVLILTLPPYSFEILTTASN